MVQTVPVDAADVLAGRYRLVERLGEGGMSVVWRAHDEVLDRQVAVKVLSPRLVADQDSRQRIRAEAQAVAKLAHPNIAGVFDFGEHDDGERVPYIVMELLTGKTLAERLEDGPLPVPEVLRICSQVATALGAAHEHGIVHRDVKPANVMVAANGQTKVVDFGVAAAVGDLADRNAVLFGTPAYVAPERLSGDAVVAATDVYGLGVLLYRMLTGHMPWSADSTTQMLVAHMYVEPDPLPPLTNLPAEVVEACEACLAKEPADRPAATEVAEILAAAAASLTGPATAPVRRSPLMSKRRQERRRSFAFAGAGIALVAVVTAAVVAATVVRPEKPAGGVTTAEDEGRTAVPGASVGVGGAGAPSNPPSGAPDSTATRPDGGTDIPTGPAASDPAVPPATTTSPPGGGQNGDPDPVRASQTSYGNTVTVECAGTMAKIVVAEPGDTWSVTRIQPGPADQVNVKFVSSTAEPFRVTFRSRCNGGVPRINLSND
jgi:eukaryotic-like serine/threonine-protein kinase